MPPKGWKKKDGKKRTATPSKERVVEQAQEQASRPEKNDAGKGFFIVEGNQIRKLVCNKEHPWRGRHYKVGAVVDASPGSKWPHHWSYVGRVDVQKDAAGRDIAKYLPADEPGECPWNEPEKWRKLAADKFKGFALVNAGTLKNAKPGLKEQARTKWERLFPNEAFPIEG